MVYTRLIVVDVKFSTMDDDVEVEDFEITDYDLMQGFGLGFRRRRMTKEEAIYGMWADKDSDDEGPSGYSGRRKKDYTKPLNFVSGGIVQKGKDKKSDKQENEGMSFNVFQRLSQ